MPSSPTAESASVSDARDLTRESFSALFTEAHRTLRVVAAAHAGAAHADDVVQQAAILAWDRRARFTPGTDFRAWMCAFVRGAAKNHRRGERRRVERHRRLGEMRGPAHGVAYDGAPGSAAAGPRLTPGAGSPTVETDGLDPGLREAIDGLKTQQRVCLLLRVLMDHSYEEIGEMLGIPPATARSHVHRARHKLAGLLAPRGAEGVRQDTPEGATR